MFLTSVALDMKVHHALMVISTYCLVLDLVVLVIIVQLSHDVMIFDSLSYTLSILVGLSYLYSCKHMIES